MPPPTSSTTHQSKTGLSGAVGAAVGSRGRAAVGSSVDTIDGRHRDDVDDVGVSEVDFENGAVVAPLDRECVVGVRYFAMGYTVDDVLR